MLIKIAGGIGMDDSMEQFGDYWYSFMYAKNLFEDHNIKSPYLVESPFLLILNASTGNHFKAIATNFDNKVKIIYLENIKGKKGIVKEVVINEYDYIVSQDWISEWKGNSNLFHEKDGDPIIHVSKKGLIVQIGERGGLTW